MKLVNRWRNRGAFVVALVLATLGLAGTANAAGWGPQLQLADGLSTNLYTHMNPAGDVTFISAKLAMTGEYEVFAQVHKADGTTLPAKTIFKDSSGGGAPFIFSQNDKDGNIYTMWATSSDGGCGCDLDQLKITRLDASGAPLPQPLTIVDFSGEMKFFSAAALSVSSNGRVTAGVGVDDIDNDERWVEVFKVSSDLSSKTKITPAGFGGDARDLDLATDSQGRTLIAWESKEFGGAVSVWSQYLDDSGPVGTAVELNDVPNDLGPMLGAVVIDDGGRGTIALAKEQVDEPGTVVVRSEPNGTFTPTLLDEAFIDISLGFYGINRKVFLTPLADGKALLALSNYAVGGDSELRTYRVNSAGVLEGEYVISAEEGVNATPSLAMRPGQGGSIGYLRMSEDIDTGVYSSTLGYRNLGADGSPVGPEEPLATGFDIFMAPVYANISIATTSADRIAVSWAEAGFGLPFLTTAYGRIYDATPPRVSIKAPTRALAGDQVVLAAEVQDLSRTVVRWNFGDGTTAEGPIQSHVFQQPGTYDLKVVAEDSVGNVGEASQQIEVVAQTQTLSRPQTQITRPPRLRLWQPRAVIHFRSTQANSSFQCRVGRGPIQGSRQARLRARGKGTRGLAVQGKWRKCNSPLRLRGLKPARYVVRIRAIGETGLRDRSPAVVRFRVMRNARKTGQQTRRNSSARA